jgi:hypothetical protein
MKKALLLLTLLVIQAAHAEQSTEPGDLVPDGLTAVAIAKAVLIPILGDTLEERRKSQQFLNSRHFYATLHNDTWIVEDAPPARGKWSKPVLRVEIDKKRGCILKVSGY